MEDAGDKALMLRKLQDRGLPVPRTWILKSEAWLSLLTHLGQGGDWPLWDAIARQQNCQRLRRQIQAYDTAPDWSALTRCAPLLLRVSLGLMDAQGDYKPLPSQFQGLLSSQLCLTPDTYNGHLKQLWSEALGASSLMVWQQHCSSLAHLRLSVIAQPLVPATLSGTLMLSGQQGLLEVVTGLGFVQSQGEAQPARCRINGQRHLWQEGYQEQSCHFNAASAGLDWQVRSHPVLVSPLGRLQLDRLLQLGQRVQQQLGTGVRLEWLVNPNAPDTAPHLSFMITQAAPWQETLAPVAEASAPGAALPSPDLPTIQAAIRGIAVASGRGLAPALVITDPMQLPATVASGCIIVARDIQPEFLGSAAEVVGIVTERGGATCHAAILARELGIPAVVGAPQATQLIQTGDYLWLDGEKGLVYIVPTPDQLPVLQRPPKPPPLAPIKTQTQVMVNLSQSSRLGDYVAAVDGVGLIRSEWLLLDGLEGRHPQRWIDAGQTRELEVVIVERLKPILAACTDKPVRYRSLDLRSHEWSTSKDNPHEVNPMLGLRGTFSYQQDFRLFQVELAALRTLQRAGYGNLELILPFVRTVEEFYACQHQIIQAGLVQVEAFRLWIMAEVPSVLFLLPAYAQAGVQGIAIGTNDLAQLLLAMDREQPHLAATYDERHPAILAAIRHLIVQAQAEGIACSLCGQAPVRFPELIELLVGWGIDSICVEPGAIDKTRRAIFAVEQALGRV